MRLQHVVFLAVALLLDRSSAQNETASEPESDPLADAGPVPPAAFRPRPNPFDMQPQVDPLSLRRIPPVPLRGFFAIRSPQAGSDRLQGGGLVNATAAVNCSEDWTKCQQWYHHPRPISKRMAMASGVPRTRRPYDVPQIECPPARDGSERFSCPSPDRTNRYRCIEDRALCDGFIDCPNAEDEDMRACMFYKTTKAHLDVLADALLRWARGRY